MVASGILIAFSDVLTTVRPKTQFSDGYFMPSNQKSPVQSPKSRKKEGGFPSDFRDFSDFWHNYPAVAFDELLNAAAEGDGSSDVV